MPSIEWTSHANNASSSTTISSRTMTVDHDSPIQGLQAAFRAILQDVGSRSDGTLHPLDITLPEDRFGDFSSALEEAKVFEKSGATLAALRGILFDLLVCTNQIALEQPLTFEPRQTTHPPRRPLKQLQIFWTSP